MKDDLERWTAAVIRNVDACILDAVDKRAASLRVGLEVHARGGKRLRTRVAAAIAGADDARLERLTLGAAALELLHLATLVHDDIIDASDQRRGMPTTWSVHGCSRAIVAGDSLFSAAFELASQVSDIYVRELGSAFAGVCDGQMEEFDDVGDNSRTCERVEHVAALKTGSLFGMAAVLGVLVTDEDDVDAARAAGTRLGVLYQLLDDFEDIDAASGAGATDIANGLLTQPWILALDTGVEPDLRQLLRREASADGAHLLQSLWRTKGPGLALRRIHAVANDVGRGRRFAQRLDGFIRTFRSSASSIAARNAAG